jgi:esterase/lipase superfamily enzyme
VLVFVHGFNTSYEDAVYRFAQIAHDAKTEAAPILFTWPSRGSVFDYVYDKDSTVFSRFALEELLRRAASSPDVGDVTILAHSMGSWLTVEALRGIAMRDKAISPKITNVVLASPDIDVDVFRRQLIEMGPSRPHLTIFASRRDHALAFSRWIAGDVDRLGAADMRPYAADLKTLGITIIDTTDVKAGDALAHSTFADSPAMVQVLGRRLSGQPLDGGDVSLADRVGMVALGTAKVVGSTAGAAVTAPAAIVSPAARRDLIQQLQGASASLSPAAGGLAVY